MDDKALKVLLGHQLTINLRLQELIFNLIGTLHFKTPEQQNTYINIIAGMQQETQKMMTILYPELQNKEE